MPESGPDGNNYISEWFGHRVYPIVVGTSQSVLDQVSETCPFLSRVKGAQSPCVKKAASRGVCTISSRSNGPRQDWLVCPYRAFDPRLLTTIAARLYGIDQVDRLHLYAAPNLAHPEIRDQITKCLDVGERALVYFDIKLGGEISLAPTPRSPEMAFDVTFVEVERQDEALSLGRFAILEIQTMDFHGSYRNAVKNLSDGLRLHGNDFPEALRHHSHWLSEGIEGPNIANVFKRTFYQMMFKFSFGLAPSCAGTVLAIPESVWDSWQRFLGAPQLQDVGDGTSRLSIPGSAEPDGKIPAWIYVFDFDADTSITPSPMRSCRMISVDPNALAHFALGEAPRAAAAHLTSHAGIYATLRRRLRSFWPEQILL